ncbi:hypothetical protein [Trebonia sp.]|uniref:hypothetical protein n=1 Tax=Trebonia sp. TaxID=2767075 RepID=UPI00262AAFD5|nr:hypothetical protein [Trebonia sp.]
MTRSSANSGSRPPFDVLKFARRTVDAIDMGDWAIDVSEERLTRIEELIAASWPRSMMLRRRLRRELRASVAGYDSMEPGFRRRRLEAAGEEVLDRADRGRKRFAEMLAEEEVLRERRRDEP